MCFRPAKRSVAGSPLLSLICFCLTSTAGGEMGNQDMHRADAPLTSKQVEQVRSRLKSKVEMLTHKAGEGVPGMEEQLGAVQVPQRSTQTHTDPHRPTEIHTDPLEPLELDLVALIVPADLVEPAGPGPAGSSWSSTPYRARSFDRPACSPHVLSVTLGCVGQAQPPGPRPRGPQVTDGGKSSSHHQTSPDPHPTLT